MNQGRKLRFVIVGLGNRGRDTFAKGLLAFPNRGLPEFKEKAEIVAFVDNNVERAKVANEVLGTSFPVYPTIADAKVQGDWAIVTTTDCTHADVAIAAIERGMNVIVDKPLATSVWECDRIVEAAEKHGKQVIVGHNLRYDEHMLAVARLVRSGAIGNAVHVEAGEVLDFDHGGDYFHRWHSEFAKSAGLMNHKCCHQLDIINWALDDSPIGVSALGERTYYVPRPDLTTATRCGECKITATCPHFCDIDAHDQRLKRMYVNVEHVDGYVRDACVFSDRHTISDHQVLNIKYSRGAIASFSLVCFAPREYNYYYFTGTAGRIEYGVSFPAGDEDTKARGLADSGIFNEAGKPYIKWYKANGSVVNVPAVKLHVGFGHGGADVKLLGSILGVKIDGVDPIQRATASQARSAVAIADMASRSVAGGGRLVTIDETGKDFPPAPPVRGKR